MGRLHGLDGLRGIAALAIAAMHFDAQFALGLGIGSLALGVDLFFVISGYVMARTYESAMREQSLSVWRFMVLRWKRLWFTLALGTIIGVPVALLRYSFDVDFVIALALALAMMPALGTALPLFAFNGPAWSLFFEITGNLAHAIGLRRIRWQWLLVIAAVMAVLLWWNGQTYIWPRGTKRALFWMTFARFFLSYIIGIVLWRLLRDRAIIPLPPYLVIAAAVTCVAYVPPLVSALLLFPLMAVAALGAKEARWATLSGQASYPLYAVHLPIFELTRIAGGGPVLACVLVAAATAFLVWMLERPRRKRSDALKDAPAF